MLTHRKKHRKKDMSIQEKTNHCLYSANARFGVSWNKPMNDDFLQVDLTIVAMAEEPDLTLP